MVLRPSTFRAQAMRSICRSADRTSSSGSPKICLVDFRLWNDYSRLLQQQLLSGDNAVDHDVFDWSFLHFLKVALARTRYATVIDQNITSQNIVFSIQFFVVTRLRSVRFSSGYRCVSRVDDKRNVAQHGPRSGRREEGDRLRGEDPSEAGQVGRSHRRGEARAEPVRRDRGRRGGAHEREETGQGGDCGVVRPAAGPGVAAHRVGHGSGPGHPRRSAAGPVRRAAAAARVQNAGPGGAGREGGRGDRRQAGHRRRRQSDGADDGRAARLAASHVRVPGDRGRWTCRGHAGDRRWAGDHQGETAGSDQRRLAAERAQVRDTAQHHEGEEEAHQENLARGHRRRRDAASTGDQR